MKNEKFLFVKVCQNDINGRPTGKAYQFEIEKAHETKVKLFTGTSGIPVNTCKDLRIHGNIFEYAGFWQDKENIAWNYMKMKESEVLRLLEILRRAGQWEASGQWAHLLEKGELAA